MKKGNNSKKTNKNVRTVMSAALLALATTSAVIAPLPNQSAQAQIPGLLPRADQVAVAEPLAIDGVWQIRELGKHIVVEAGRAYALESWVHAFVFEIQPDMVVLRNFQQKAPNVYVADDLPLMGRANMVVEEDGSITATVAGLVPVTYHLDPVELFYPQHFIAAIQDSRVPAQYRDRPGPPSHALGPPQPGVIGQPRIEAQPALEPGVTEPYVERCGNCGLLPPGVAGQAELATGNNGSSDEGGLSDEVKLGIGTVVVGGIAYKVSGSVGKTAKTVGSAGRAARGGKVAGKLTQGRLNGGILQKAGPKGTSQLIGKGNAARAARGAGPVTSEAQLMQRINKAGDISKLNKAGRAAQVARGAGGIKAASTAKDAARLAKVAKTGATAGKLGKAGRAALAGTGVGAAVVVGEIVATESIEALTGAEVQDPVSTTFQYGAAIFDKDVKLGDVAKARAAHHRENFRKIGETFTTKGKFKENMRAYGDDKRVKIEGATGMDLQSGRERRATYKAAMTSEKPVAATAKVMGDRAKHHLKNTGKVTKKVGCGLGNIFRKKENDKKC
ncbi:MAG: hypothetical protein ABJN65_15050 [Parasphingorhabdus sp.]